MLLVLAHCGPRASDPNVWYLPKPTPGKASRQALAESVEKTKNEPVGNFRRRRRSAIVAVASAVNLKFLSVFSVTSSQELQIQNRTRIIYLLVLL
jgi:hypothetical protein